MARAELIRMQSEAAVPCFVCRSLPAHLHDWCFSLVKSLLHDLYMPVWGWSDEEKRKQLSAVSAASFCLQAQVLSIHPV
jgi:hypothetical protein